MGRQVYGGEKLKHEFRVRQEPDHRDLCTESEADEFNSQDCYMPLRVKENQCHDLIQNSEKNYFGFILHLFASVNNFIKSYIVIQI